jgi:hypothetical protein
MFFDKVIGLRLLGQHDLIEVSGEWIFECVILAIRGEGELEDFDALREWLAVIGKFLDDGFPGWMRDELLMMFRKTRLDWWISSSSFKILSGGLW